MAKALRVLPLFYNLNINGSGTPPTTINRWVGKSLLPHLFFTSKTLQYRQLEVNMRLSRLTLLSFVFICLISPPNSHAQIDQVLQPEKEDQQCSQDSDCTVVLLNCGDCICGQYPVNKLSQVEYRMKAQQYCQDHPTGVCDNACLGPMSVECREGSCQASQQPLNSPKHFAIPGYFLNCEQDSDCTPVTLQCGGCDCNKYISINKNAVLGYNSYYERACGNQLGEQCEIECGHMPKCILNQCMFANCSSNQNCENLDCSSFNSPSKEGYKPYCIDNTCQCMCYGCK